MSSMVRLPVRCASLLSSVALVLVLMATSAAGDGRTDFLLARLKADDFRVRTNAALALGATNDEAVVAPLCGVLSDPSEVVRQAVAAALKRLAKPSALGCLKARHSVESLPSVKLQIARAIEALEAGGGSDAPATDAPKLVPHAKFYVALSSISNATGRPQSEIDRLVFSAVRGKFDSLGAYQLAPEGEAAAAARATMSKRKLKGYYLSIGVERFNYDGGDLSVKVKVAVFTYPGKDLRGEVPVGLTQKGVRPGDRAAEDNLLAMCAANAIELFAQNFQ